MGMCKECKEIFSAIEMRNGVCKACMSEEELELFEETLLEKQKQLDEDIENSKIAKNSRIVNLKFFGTFLFLTLFLYIVYYFIDESYPDMDELITVVFFLSIATSIYTGFMALIELIKKMDTSNKIWLVSSAISSILLLALMVVNEEGDSLFDILFFLGPVIILPKLAFIIREYFDKQTQKEIAFLKESGKYEENLEGSKKANSKKSSKYTWYLFAYPFFGLILAFITLPILEGDFEWNFEYFMGSFFLSVMFFILASIVLIVSKITKQFKNENDILLLTASISMVFIAIFSLVNSIEQEEMISMIVFFILTLVTSKITFMVINKFLKEEEVHKKESSSKKYIYLAFLPLVFIGLNLKKFYVESKSLNDAKVLIEKITLSIEKEHQRRVLKGDFTEITSIGDDDYVFNKFNPDVKGIENQVLEESVKSISLYAYEIGTWEFDKSYSSSYDSKYILNIYGDSYGVEFKIIDEKFICTSYRTNLCKKLGAMTP